MTNPAGELATGPVSHAERIRSLDVLRGFAILGILVMNVQSFAMIAAAYLNPRAYGDLTGANWFVWLVSHVFFDRKFMTIFAILFGAGIALMTTRRAVAGRKSAAVHYRRMLVLLIFGLLHAYLIWYGDILYTYAICGMLVFLIRNWRPRTLVILALIFIAIPSLFNLGGQATMPMWPEAERQELRETWWQPSDAAIEAELAHYRSDWLAQIPPRIEAASMFQTFFLLQENLWRVSGLMLIGIVLMRWNVLSATRAPRLYTRLAQLGFGLGLPIVAYGVYHNVSTGWTLERSFFAGAQFNYWGSILVAFGWIALVMIACQRHWLAALQARLAAVGRMALTNYLLQSVTCALIFYGHGLGLAGDISRVGQVLVVLGLWAVQLMLSPWWLSRFQFGPVEWLWRTLTYWQAPPFRRALPDFGRPSPS
jgi:uncharacterized protein